MSEPTAAARDNFRNACIAGVLLYAGLWLTWLALEPGRSGGWIFDDFSNLWELAKINHEPSWYTTFQ